MNKLILIFLILFPNLFHASVGNDQGNGGDVVTCGNSVELLDIYEARSIGYELVIPKGQNYHEMLQTFFKNHLSKFQPKRSKLFLKYLDSFQSEAQFLPGIVLNDIDDSGLVVLPAGCKSEQIIVQMKDEEIPQGRKRYTVSFDLWNKLDEFNKMGLVLHEFLFREAIENNSPNSMAVRGMVAQLLKTQTDLVNYLGLESKLLNRFEYIDLTIACENYPSDYPKKLCRNRFNFSIFENEYQELILKITNNNQQGHLVGSYKGYSIDSLTGNMGIYPIEVRISDGVTFNQSTYKFGTLKYVRANVKYLLALYQQLKVSLTFDRELFLVEGAPLDGTPFSLNIKNEEINKQINLSNIIELSCYDDCVFREIGKNKMIIDLKSMKVTRYQH